MSSLNLSASTETTAVARVALAPSHDLPGTVRIHCEVSAVSSVLRASHPNLNTIHPAEHARDSQ